MSQVSKEAVVSDTQQGEKEIAAELGFTVILDRLPGIGHVPRFVEQDGDTDTDYTADNRHHALYELAVAARLRLREVERERDTERGIKEAEKKILLAEIEQRVAAESRLAQAGKELEDARTYILEDAPDDSREWSKDDPLATWIHQFGMDIESAEHEHMKARAGKLAEAVRAYLAANQERFSDIDGALMQKYEQPQSGEIGSAEKALRSALLDFDSLASAPKISRR